MGTLEFSDLQKVLGLSFRDQSLLRQSLIHRSYTNETPDFVETSNERLEYLGDALLGFVIAERLYSKFPDLAEGELTKLRSALVRKETLARLASNIRLGDYLYLGRGEEGSGGRQRQRSLAGAFEALLGAVLLDRGFTQARDFVLKVFLSELERVAEERGADDHKSKLQEVLQAKQKTTPVYQTVAVEGPDHARVFTVAVRAGDRVIGQGTGRSKQDAEKEAARQALANLAP